MSEFRKVTDDFSVSPQIGPEDMAAARVEDAAGNPIRDVPVVWQPSQSVSVSNASSNSDANGIVSATATLGSATGATQVQLRTVSATQTPFSPGGNGCPSTSSCP